MHCRTSLVNQIRGLLLERGITIRKGRQHAEEALTRILEDPDTNLSGPLRTLLAQLQDELKHLQSQIEEADGVIFKTASEHEACVRLMAIPAIPTIAAHRPLLLNDLNFAISARSAGEQMRWHNGRTRRFRNL